MPSSIVDVLLASEEPSVRWKVRVHALGEDPDSLAIRRLQGQVRRAPRTRALLDGWAANPCGSYTKWQGGHWVLAATRRPRLPGRRHGLCSRSATSCCAPGSRRATCVTASRRGRQTSRPRRQPASRSWPAGTGAAARSRATHCCRPSSSGWTTVAPPQLVERLLHWQWPDGGWNCDTSAGRDLVVGVRDAAADARPARLCAESTRTRPRRPAPAAPPRSCSNAGCCSAGPPAG